MVKPHPAGASAVGVEDKVHGVQEDVGHTVVGRFLQPSQVVSRHEVKGHVRLVKKPGVGHDMVRQARLTA